MEEEAKQLFDLLVELIDARIQVGVYQNPNFGDATAEIAEKIFKLLSEDD